MAVQLAEQIMDQVELEGRLTYLNKNNTAYTAPSDLVGLLYINSGSVDRYYKIDPAYGKAVQTATADGALFHVNMEQTIVAGTGLSDVTVRVTFTDVINPTTNMPIQRVATISRRILHG